jgi:hypothetical protein
MKSRARISPTKSKKNRFMIAQPSQNRSVPKFRFKEVRPKRLQHSLQVPRRRTDLALPLTEVCR